MDIKSFSDKDLFEEFARRMKCSVRANQKVLFVGPPGGGKGTQTPKLEEKYCWCPISTGDMLREAVSKGTDLGKQAKDIMNRGDLVPDDLVIGLIKEKINKPECKYGFILDGFPRNLKQAEKLDELLNSQNTKIDKIFKFNVPDELLTERITGRRIHKPSGRSYHVKFNPPKVDGIDDVTGEPLIHRKDDKKETLVNRLKLYHTQTAPILAHYASTGSIVDIDATQSIDNIWDQIQSNIQFNY